MNRPRIAIAGLLLAGTTLLAPLTASADPTFGITSGGTSVIGTVGSTGQPLEVSGAGCLTNGGQPGYMGLFISTAGDPLTNPNSHVFELAADNQGSVDWNATIDQSAAGLTYSARMYCSVAPDSTLDADSVSDPNLLWVSPVGSMQIAANGNPNAMRASKATTTVTKKATKKAAKKATKKTKHGATKVTAAVTSSGVTFTTDKDALPAVDRIGVYGRQAAALKVQCDIHAADPSLSAKALTNAHYVTACFQVIAKKQPATSVMAPYVDELNAGVTRVQVVEQIALTKQAAAWWNANL